MEEKVFVGYSYGRFQTDEGKILPYCNVFVLEPFAGEENEDYHFCGQKAVKYGCVSVDVFQGIPLNTKVLCFFNGNRKVIYMLPADKAGNVLSGQANAS